VWAKTQRIADEGTHDGAGSTILNGRCWHVSDHP
jgi:hypothetical protein